MPPFLTSHLSTFSFPIVTLPHTFNHLVFLQFSRLHFFHSHTLSRSILITLWWSLFSINNLNLHNTCPNYINNIHCSPFHLRKLHISSTNMDKHFIITTNTSLLTSIKSNAAVSSHCHNKMNEQNMSFHLIGIHIHHASNYHGRLD